MSETEQPELARLTVELLCAYVANNTVPSESLAALIETTRAALAGEPSVPVVPMPEYKPAVTIEASLASPEHIVSLIDGKPYKTLKRHLSNNGLTPAEYRARYDLAADYPLVAPSYSEKRRSVAKKMGLGGRPAPTAAGKAEAAPEAVKPTGRNTAKPAAQKAKAAKSATVKSPKAEAKPVAAPAVPAAKSPEAVESASAATASSNAPKAARKMARPRSTAATAAKTETAAPAAPAKTATSRKKLGISTGSSPAATPAAELTNAKATPKSADKAAVKAAPKKKAAATKSKKVSATTAEVATPAEKVA
ncbi:MAG: MucR family transcriptional regulator [Novosphingobium sp.]|nr:MucR family transcriptional regulator [Novosphingobium sp.]